MDETKKQTLLTGLRQLVAVASTIVAALGYANDQVVQAWLGAVGAIIPIAIELWATFTSEKKTEGRVIDGVNAGLAHAHETTPEGVNVPQVTDKEAKNIAQAYEQNK